MYKEVFQFPLNKIRPPVHLTTCWHDVSTRCRSRSTMLQAISSYWGTGENHSKLN